MARKKTWLYDAAKELAAALKPKVGGSRWRIQIPTKKQLTDTDTDGWAVRISRGPPDQPRLEVWLDLFTRHKARKLYVGFRLAKPLLGSEQRKLRRALPYLTLNEGQANKVGGLMRMLEPLPSGGFNQPILEKYSTRQWFGLFDNGEGNIPLSVRFRSQAVSFVEETVQALGLTSKTGGEKDAYPREENRRAVRSHLVRERNRFLANACKERDGFICQACFGRLQEPLGTEIGRDCAEAHHVVSLATLNGKVLTKLEDLMTVCPNCHRALHRMNGEVTDIKKLRAVLK